MSIDQIAYNNNFTNKNPRAKMLLGFLLIIFSLVFENVYFHAALTLLIIMALKFYGGISFRSILRLYKIPLGFLFISIAVILINITKDINNVKHYIIIGRFYVGTTAENINTAINTLSRSIACLSSTYFIALSTPINQIVKIFKDIHLPRIFVEQFILIYRYINVFMTEYKDMEVALTLKHANIGFYQKIKSTAMIGSKLFIKMMTSYRDWKNALDLKLFDGNFYY